MSRVGFVPGAFPDGYWPDGYWRETEDGVKIWYPILQISTDVVRSSVVPTSVTRTQIMGANIILRIDLPTSVMRSISFASAFTSEINIQGVVT